VIVNFVDIVRIVGYFLFIIRTTNVVSKLRSHKKILQEMVVN